MTEYEREETQLFEYFMDTQLIPKGTEKEHAIAKHELELILNTNCDQQCKYCYLVNHGKGLYPVHASNEVLLKNVDLILDYVYNNRKCHFYTIDLFGGEIVRNNLIFDTLDLIKKYFLIVQEQEPDLFKYRLTRIIIPNNLSFVPSRPDIVEKIYQYQEEFQTRFNTRIMFSWSCDGPYSSDIREQKTLDESYYDAIIEFCKKSSSGCHPMISSVGIDSLKDNYIWWLDVSKRLSDRPEEFQPMFLEVRNDDWTEESIKKYLSFLDFAMEKRLELCNNDVEELAYHLFAGDGANNSLPAAFNYDFLKFPIGCSKRQEQESFTCNMQRAVYFNCNNLSLVICHRLSYNHLVGCYFNTDENNEHIIGLTPHNLNAYINIHIMKASMHPTCDTCKYLPYCMQGCLGAQAEANGDPLMPCTTVCSMIQAKLQYLIKLYNDYGVFKHIDNNRFGKIRMDKQQRNFIANILKEYGYEFGK